MILSRLYMIVIMFVHDSYHVCTWYLQLGEELRYLAPVNGSATAPSIWGNWRLLRLQGWSVPTSLQVLLCAVGRGSSMHQSFEQRCSWEHCKDAVVPFTCLWDILLNTIFIVGNNTQDRIPNMFGMWGIRSWVPLVNPWNMGWSPTIRPLSQPVKLVQLRKMCQLNMYKCNYRHRGDDGEPHVQIVMCIYDVRRSWLGHMTRAMMIILLCWTVAYVKLC